MLTDDRPVSVSCMLNTETERIAISDGGFVISSMGDWSKSRKTASFPSLHVWSYGGTSCLYLHCHENLNSHKV